MLRDIIRRFGATKVIAVLTAISVVISVVVTVTGSVLYGYRDLDFAIFVSAAVPLVLAPAMFYAFLRLLEKLDQSELQREKLIGELQDALAKVKVLSGLIPICSKCKKIRDDKGFWNQIESYLKAHSEAEFTHGLCPDCQKDLLDLYEKNRPQG